MGEQYNIILHETAERELDSIPDEPRSDFIQLFKQASKLQQPTSHSNVKPLRDTDGLFRFRVSNYRALGDLDLPNLRILAVGKREGFYEKKKHEAIDRATDSI